jgi:hypothetical protein
LNVHTRRTKQNVAISSREKCHKNAIKSATGTIRAHLDVMGASMTDVGRGEMMFNGRLRKFRHESLARHGDPVEQLLRTCSAALVQPGTQLRKMQKRTNGLHQTQTRDARFCFPGEEKRNVSSWN